MAAAGGVRVPLQVSRHCVIASVQVDLTQEVIEALQDDVLELISDSGATGLVLDLSGVDPLDPEEFSALRRVMEMSKLMGARPVISGLRPGVVSALIDLDCDVDDVDATRTTDDAIVWINESSDDVETMLGTPHAFTDDLDSNETDHSDPI